MIFSYQSAPKLCGRAGFGTCEPRLCSAGQTCYRLCILSKVKPVLKATCIKQSPVSKGHNFGSIKYEVVEIYLYKASTCLKQPVFGFSHRCLLNTSLTVTGQLTWSNHTEAWHFMWIICLADDSHEMSSYFLWQNMQKKKKMPSAAVVINALRVKFRHKNFFSNPHSSQHAALFVT